MDLKPALVLGTMDGCYLDCGIGRSTYLSVLGSAYTGRLPFPLRHIRSSGVSTYSSTARHDEPIFIMFITTMHEMLRLCF
jgi:hypothetical protein